MNDLLSITKELTSKGPKISICTISRSWVLLVAHFFLCFVCFPLIQFTQIFRSIKSRSWRITFFINLSILSLEWWSKRLCHKKVDHSFTKLCLMQTLWCRVKTFSTYKPSVATCPLRASEGEAHGCAFQRRKDARSRHQHLFMVNVGKTEKDVIYEL